MQLPLGISALLIRIISYNIRYAATDRGTNEQPWQGVRAPRVISQIKFNTITNPAAFVGLQEVLKSQLDDIMNCLNEDSAQNEPEWAFLGVGRNDGREAGEYSPLLYRPSIWQLQDSSTIWLSPTPDVPGSKGWDAAVTRILTIGDFRHRETGELVTAMNTHLDHVGTVARENSARIITEQIHQRLNASPHSDDNPPAIFLTGDFNSEPNQEAYHYLTQDSSPISDVRGIIPTRKRYGHQNGTFSGFRGRSDTLIDYIFLSKGERWRARTYAVLANVFDQGIYYSDHRPVVADVELRPSQARAYEA